MLLPGYEAKPGMRNLQPGEKLWVELADGSRRDTVVVKTQLATFSDSAQGRFLRAAPGFYMAVIVPNDFDAPGIELGAKVFVEDAPSL